MLPPKTPNWAPLGAFFTLKTPCCEVWDDSCYFTITDNPKIAHTPKGQQVALYTTIQNASAVRLLNLLYYL